MDNWFLFTMEPITITCTHCKTVGMMCIYRPCVVQDIVTGGPILCHLIKWPNGWIHGISPEADFIELCDKCKDVMVILEVITEMYFYGPLTYATFHAQLSYDDIEQLVFFANEKKHNLKNEIFFIKKCCDQIG